MSTKKQATKRPVGRPPSGLPPRQRRFLQIEHTDLFIQNLQIVKEIIAGKRNLPPSAISQTEAIRTAVFHYALTMRNKR